MNAKPASTTEFKGRHMLMIMLAFFGVIISVNVFMAVKAQTSWTGFVVRNSHVAGREFNRKAEEGRKQAALGWSSQLSVADGVLRYALADRQGSKVWLSGGTATLRRPVSDTEDTTLQLVSRDGTLEAGLAVSDGAWIVELIADAGRELPYRETRRVVMRNGAIR